MKKVICVLSALALLLTLASCGGNGTSPGEKSDVNIDVDLTKLSSTMIYAEVNNMMTRPEDYIGKTVKMSGQFALYQATDENGLPVPGQIYFACVIADATACCQQGIEFVLAGDHRYPEDYPPVGSDITVTGEFRTYIEGQYQYCHLIGSTLG